MPNYTFICETCESTALEQFKIADRPDDITCACGGKATFRIVPVPLMIVALPDGVKRAGWAELREASKINKQMANERPENRKAMANEIKKLGADFGDGNK